MSDIEEQRIVHLSDEQLEALGLFGTASDQRIKNVIESVREFPELLQWVTVFHLQYLRRQSVHNPDGSVTPTPPMSSEATVLSTTAVEPGFVSPFERVHFYTGISEHPPELLHRSDVLTRPFAVPKGRHSVIPDKTVHGAFDPVLTPALWRSTVCPEIVALLKDKKRGIRLTTIMPVRFSIPDENGKPIFDRHIVIWITVHPNTTTEATCRDINPDILAILEKHGVKDAAVHWIEGVIEHMVSPAMMSIVDETDPTTYSLTPENNA